MSPAARTVPPAPAPAPLRSKVPWAAIAALLAAGWGCYPFAFALPPARSDLGYAVVSEGGAVSSGMRVSTGVSWASGVRNPSQHHDVTAGYVYERVTLEDGFAGGEPATGSSEQPRAPQIAQAQGGFVDYGRVLWQRGATRVWLSGRGELLSAGGELIPAAAARLTWEAFAPGSGTAPIDSKCAAGIGTHSGTSSIGFFVEQSYREVASGAGAFSAVAGVVVRTPILAAVGVAIAGCK